jgi:hypothetical protein
MIDRQEDKLAWSRWVPTGCGPLTFSSDLLIEEFDWTSGSWLRKLLDQGRR